MVHKCVYLYQYKSGVYFSTGMNKYPILDALIEFFHCSPQLLTELPGTTFCKGVSVG